MSEYTANRKDKTVSPPPRTSQFNTRRSSWSYYSSRASTSNSNDTFDPSPQRSNTLSSLPDNVKKISFYEGVYPYDALFKYSTISSSNLRRFDLCAPKSARDEGNNDNHHEIVNFSMFHDGIIATPRNRSNNLFFDNSNKVDNDSNDDNNDNNDSTSNRQQHTFTRRRKLLIVWTVSISAMFSPLSSDIYIPALPTISSHLHVSLSTIRWSMTSYLLCQAIAPSFWGWLADSKGRRGILVMTFVLFIIANVVLARAHVLWLLILFRGVQSAGSAATIAIGAGVIADISEPTERGGYMGNFAGTQAIGPVLGGWLSKHMGWHFIFIFLIILSCTVLVLILLFLPETLRSIAGDGSVKLASCYHPWIYLIYPKSQPSTHTIMDKSHQQKLRLMDVLFPLKTLVEKDVFCLLSFGALTYSVFLMIASSHAHSLVVVYGYDDFHVGLCFLPAGIGCVFASLTSGIIMDRNWIRTETRFRQQRGLMPEILISKTNLDDFPLEMARLKPLPYLTILFVTAVVMYGWFLQAHVHIASVLSAHFLAAASMTAIFNVNSTMTIDLFPGSAASATAMNNLMRCLFAAVGQQIIGPMVNNMDRGWTFSTLALLVVGATPLLILQRTHGPKWRMTRNARLYIESISRKPKSEE